MKQPSISGLRQMSSTEGANCTARPLCIYGINTSLCVKDASIDLRDNYIPEGSKIPAIVTRLIFPFSRPTPRMQGKIFLACETIFILVPPYQEQCTYARKMTLSLERTRCTSMAFHSDFYGCKSRIVNLWHMRCRVTVLGLSIRLSVCTLI